MRHMSLLIILHARAANNPWTIAMLAPAAAALANVRFILASASPRRRDILRMVGVELEVMESNFAEDLDKSLFATALSYCRETCIRKALRVVAQCGEVSKPTLILAADTVVSVSGKILEKPEDESDARRMLRLLSGRGHTVFTVVTLVYIKPGGEMLQHSFFEATNVEFAPLTDAVIEAYIASGEPFDKAGGYGIQGIGGSLIRGIRGDYYNVMGLPLHQVCVNIASLLQAGPEAPLSRIAQYTLVLVRHGESEWNKSNRFTGWYDVALSEAGHAEAAGAGQLLREAQFQFDVAFTSYLKRAIGTCWHVLEACDQMWVPIRNAWQLNERHYGQLQGLDKKETVERHGAEQVHVWRRSYDIPPPPLENPESNPYFPGNDRRYQCMSPEEWPTTESLKSTLDRVLPFWESDIAPIILSGKRTLIAAHGNSLRALVKHLDGISEAEIPGLNIPTAVPLIYVLDANLRPIPQEGAISPLTGRYLGDPEDVRARISGVVSQTAAK